MTTSQKKIHQNSVGNFAAKKKSMVLSAELDDKANEITKDFNIVN